MRKPLFDQAHHYARLNAMQPPDALRSGFRRYWVFWAVVAAALAVVALEARPMPDDQPNVAEMAGEYSDLNTLTLDEWRELVGHLEDISQHSPDDYERELAAMEAHLAREGYRLGEAGGRAWCVAKGVRKEAHK